MSEEPLPLVWTGPEAADWLHVGIQTLYPLLASGEVPGGRKVGREWRVSVPVLIEWFDGTEATQLPVLLEAEQVAEALKVKIQTAYRLLRSGQIPSRRIGRRYLVSRHQLRSYLLSSSPSEH
jgi:excisionase family DNA binding protein